MRKNFKDKKKEPSVYVPSVSKLTDWSNEPSVSTLRSDYTAAKPSHDAKISQINKWEDIMKARGEHAPKVRKDRSKVQPKTARRAAEWRYSALSEPFHSSQKIFKVEPVTFEDVAGAKQNEMVLNYQFRTKINRIKFVDEVVRGTVDEGTCIIQAGWCRKSVMVTEEVPIWDYFSVIDPETGQGDEEYLKEFTEALEAKKNDPRGFELTAPEEIRMAIEYYENPPEDAPEELKGLPVRAQLSDKTEKVKTEKIIENYPTAVVRDPRNVIIDPSCGGDLDKAMFAILTFETSKSELEKEKDRYKNLNLVQWEGKAPVNDPNHYTKTPDTFNMSGVRKKVVAYEYWGYYDVKGDGILVPIVATWIGDIMIRMEENPFPDQKIPFVVIPYLPLKRELHGETDAELIEDNQKIIGAVMRGLIDSLGRSANAQMGMAKGMLDTLNKRRFETGDDYEFNPNIPVQNGLIEHKFPEFPSSALNMLGMMNQDAESLTGVKSFSGGISGAAYGDVAAGVRGALDAASKREMAILRRIAKGMSDLARKWSSMNSVFLSKKETIRITNEEFVEFSREDLVGEFDFSVDINTAEIDDSKAQELGFILQTVGNNMDPSFTVMILADIADLKKMPELAERLRRWAPQPDPIAQELQKIELEKAKIELEELKAEIALKKAKAKEAEANADLKTLDFVEQETGTKHERDLQKQKAQSEGNQNLEIVKNIVKPRKPDETEPEIEAAIGFNSITGNDRGAPAIPQTTAPVQEFAPEMMPQGMQLMNQDPAMDPGMDPNMIPQPEMDPGMLPNPKEEMIDG